MLRPIATASTTPVLPTVKLHNPLKSNHPPPAIRRKPFVLSSLTLTKTLTRNRALRFAATSSESTSENEWEFRDAEIGEDNGGGDEGCPWEGAIVYKRNAAVLHLEYCTTLERLGLGRVSSAVSRNRASQMGLRVVRPVRDSPDGTPVLVSVGVTRRKQKLRLDGIVRTVLALNCNRCGEPAAQSLYLDFSLLLCEQPIPAEDTINMGVIFGDDKSKNFGMEDNEENEDASIDLDDQLYFPVGEKTIDISKNIRDLIHLEINFNAVCDPGCKGLCLNCGANLNINKCSCKEDVKEKSYRPLGDLRKQMQQS
ncbi:hypothetical protein STAS_25588 [Striga asiatica]|uniref:Large ribosomal RNA subunit accumulation protein YceD n=1 Tax=Striga asiatica TaxID=4170 RepID=A0A5A7QT52_STRAF|nr:hypothetical protein STAS_25588 [Striga asiatica]